VAGRGLASALRQGPPVTEVLLAIRAATLNLITVAAERALLLVVADDAHRLDAASVECLTFAVRRLKNDRAVALFAVRGPSALDGLRLRELRLTGLAEADATALLADRFGLPMGAGGDAAAGLLGVRQPTGPAGITSRSQRRAARRARAARGAVESGACS
jgi:hypothetical protein